MSKLKVGVIGVGSIAELGHFPFYQKNPDVELVALADLDHERAEAMAKKFNIAKVYSHYEDMLQEEQLDAVSVCTPNGAHIQPAIAAVKQGVDVLVEKPLGTSFEECNQLLDAVNQEGRIAMVGMTHRYRNEAKALKTFVENGDLGDIYYAKARILRRRGTPTGWFTDFSKSGGGPLMDIGVHALDLVWWLLGKPVAETVSGHLVTGIGRYETAMQSRWTSAVPYNQKNEVFDVEDFASAFIRFQNGLAVNLEASWATNGAQDEGIKIDIFGSKGGVSIEPLKYYTEQNNIFVESDIAIDKNNPYETEINHFVSSVLERKTPISPVTDGAKVVQILEAIQKSSELKKEVSLNVSNTTA
ncbi:putative dehydrogenase [Pullulanibacillus pueri]|uniref:Oxidoreductase n=1 Tax=Pullulanibacillus pueri TaxID=1437324 RepID=A0A8J2ZYT0_9BACL|nr:Gfo/Idh/MocA family oxidoreductase [Pullulanibacillus pueri]MBM7683668.1 putative dehydrogenase [Pullulanibacillus pueri]GGH87168.1 oxidoreductase [Pullulanibacillus pueri]